MNARTRRKHGLWRRLLASTAIFATGLASLACDPEETAQPPTTTALLPLQDTPDAPRPRTAAFLSFWTV